MPTNEDFYDFYDDDLVDLVFLDEFHGNKTIQCLNSWLDGSEMVVRVKGSQRIKRKNQPFIIASNYLLSEAYSKALAQDFSKIDSLRARLLEVQLTEKIDLDNVQFNINVEGEKDEDEFEKWQELN